MSLRSLRRLAESPEAMTKLKAWIEMTGEQRSTAYGQTLSAGGGKVVRDTVPGCLIPFHLGSDNKIVVPCRLLNGATGGQAGTVATAVKGITNGYVFELAAKPSGFEMPEFAKAFKRAARVTLTLKSGATEGRTSRITGLRYSAKQSDSCSQSFGMKPTETEPNGSLKSYDDVAAAAGTWAGAAEERSYKMTPEGSR